MKKKPKTVVLVRSDRNKLTGPAIASIGYLSLAIYLYYPYFSRLKPIEFILIINSTIAATGCFVLSRRWLSKYPASFLAGIIYGFGPFALSLAAYHPLGGIGFALFPWLFCPAALLKLKTDRKIYALLINGVLSLLPFVIITFIYWLLAQRWLGPFFPLPKHYSLGISNLPGIITPLILKGQEFVFSFYHIPLIISFMGLFMFYAAGRIWITIIVTTGIILACCNSILQVSPILWASVPVLFVSILVGMGMQGFALAGNTDKKWLLACLSAAAIMITAVIIIGLISGWSKLLNYSLIMYILAILLVASIYFTAKAHLRWHMFRWFLLCAGIGLDVLISSRFIIDNIF